MNENMEYNEFEQRNNIRDRMFDIWSKYKKHLIVLACFIILLTIVLVIVLNRPKTYTKYPDIERIMIINAQNYVKNNNLANNSYISLNNLNIKIDENLKCDSLSGVYKEKDNLVIYVYALFEDCIKENSECDGWNVYSDPKLNNKIDEFLFDDKTNNDEIMNNHVKEASKYKIVCKPLDSNGNTKYYWYSIERLK